MKNMFQALKALYYAFQSRKSKPLRDAIYPVIPATHANRAVRRAVIYGHPLPQMWDAWLRQQRLPQAISCK